MMLRNALGGFTTYLVGKGEHHVAAKTFGSPPVHTPSGLHNARGRAYTLGI